MKALVLRIVVLVLITAAALPAADAKEPRNVLFLIADDLNCYLGCYDHPLAKTPHIDRLAERGTLFKNAYCQYPVCNASRASIFTGLRPDVNGVRENWTHFRHVVPQVKTMSQWFRENGYFAARVGKIYHYNVPKEIGMDCMDDPASWDLRFNPIGRDKWEEEEITTLLPGRYGATLSWMAQDGPDTDQTDGKGATAAIRILENFGDAEKPFFLAFGLFRPHTPYVAPKKYFDMYPLDQIEPATGIEEDWKDIPPVALLSLHKEEKDLSTEVKKEVIQSYLASISFMDAQVGRVLEALERLGLADDTLVVMTSDHGYHMSEHGLWMKQSLFEESARVPLVVASPSAKGHGGVSDSIVELIDLYPTLCDWAGIGLPDDFERDGVSLGPILDDPEASGKGYAITQVYRPSYRMRPLGKEMKSVHGYSVRTPRYRYNLWDRGEFGEELYDHKNDPAELANLAWGDATPEVREQLKKRLAKFEKAHGAPEPLSGSRLLNLKPSK